MPPAAIAPNAHAGIDGKSATAPFADEIEWASHSSPSIASPVIHQKGCPQPTMSNANAAASLGMITKVVSGIATMFPKTP